MREAFAAGQRDMREKAANVCADLEYTGWNGEYMKHGPETDANEEFRKCEDGYERQRKGVITRQKLGEAWAPWMDKKPEPTSNPCELGPLPFNAVVNG